MGQTRAERTWPRPRSVRHVWVRFRDLHPQQPPDPGLIFCWRRQTGEWEALVIAVRAGPDGDPVVVQQWVAARDVRPLEADPNRAFGLR